MTHGRAGNTEGECLQITMRDVAARAGVNPSTVSRVLAADRRISQETRNRVLEAVAELDYHRTWAQQVRSRRGLTPPAACLESTIVNRK